MSRIDTPATTSAPKREWWLYLLLMAAVPLLVAAFLPSLRTPSIAVAALLTVGAFVALARHGTSGLDSLRDI